jgi:hypothetical protein
MDLLTNAFRKIKSSSQAAVPTIGNVTRKGITAAGNLGGIIINTATKKVQLDGISSLLKEANIKYGDEKLLQDDNMLDQHLMSSKPKEVIKALNTILAVLVYFSNKIQDDSITPNQESAMNEEDDMRTRILKRFYPGVVK